MSNFYNANELGIKYCKEFLTLGRGTKFTLELEDAEESSSLLLSGVNTGGSGEVGDSNCLLGVGGVTFTGVLGREERVRS